MYQIKISYRTGDSFGSEDCEQYIEYKWDNLEMAKESLQRIKNHYWVYQETDGYNKPEDWLDVVGVVWSDEFRWLSLELISDTMKPFKYPSFWTGYFEELYSAEIIVSGDTEMKFEI